jgi:flagellar biosynthesis protein FliR
MGVPDLQQMVAAMTLTGVRVGGIMVFAPFTGSDSIAAPFKAVLTLLITVLVYPGTRMPGINADPLGWIKVVVGEAVIGLALGLLLQFSFEAVQFAGQIFGMQTGFSLVTLLDPQNRSGLAFIDCVHAIDGAARIPAIERSPLAAARSVSQFFLSASGRSR